MATTHEQTDTESPWVLDREAGIALFDRQARRRLGMPGDEFLRRYDAGDYDDVPDDEAGREVMHMIMLIPFARRDS